MVTSSRGGDSSSSRSKEKEFIASISWKVSQLKKQVQAARSVSIRDKILKNRKNLEANTRRIFELSKEKEVAREAAESGNLLSVRLADPLCLLSAWEPDKEIASIQEEIAASASIMFGSSCGRKSLVCLTKLPFVEKIPPYTTWIFLNRNQRMTEDQSVLGRRQIYYDPYGNETLICSDSEEEFVEPEDEKHEFSEGEDWILWKAIQECGLNQEVLHVLCHSIEVLPEEIQERYEALMGKHIKNSESKVEISSEPEIKQLLDKTLNAALDSFDNLFCRRCLIFDCRLHGCSQNLITVSEKLPYGSDPDENRKPCSKHCYLNRRENKEGLFSAEKDSNQTNKTESASPSEHEDSNCDDDITRVTPSDGLCSDVNKLTIVSSETVGSMLAHATVSSCAIERNIPVVSLKNLVNVGKRKNLKHGIFSSGKPHIFQKSVGPADKKQKKISLYDTFQASKKLEKLYTNIISNPDTKTHGWAANCIQLQHESKEYPFQTQDGHTKNHGADIQDTKIHKITEVSLLKSLSSSSRKQASGWSLFEKDLYLKGVEIFGKNSCLIARNLLSGLKTCIEVSKYMFNDGASLQTGPLFTSSYLDDIGGCDPAMTEHDTPARTKIWRKRGRAKKLKYTWKSAGHPSIRKRIGDGKPQPCKQYTPCGCWQMCGKQCSCLENGTCCEKYCGCSKSCKNRFRGCHCAKSQCRSRQCPCFAAGRECDPDVCRNCWVSCGDGSVDEPQSAGDSYQCGNMKLLLRQQQRILLARSDVAGWGAFIRNPVNKNDYLGEYTGELVSHKEADKRGKIYDRANSSFLFDLNDQFVLDAYRKGDKLKFANHSSNPNCYAKVMLVAGDHRVGIYAKEHIEAGEELFYDYRYGLDQAPAWARKPEGSKRDDPTHSLCRAKKIALPCHELL